MVSTLATARASFMSAFSSHRALRVPLAASLVVGAMLATSALPTEALAQRGKKDEQEAPAPEQNSQGFIAAYQPLAEMVTGEVKDWAGAAARVPQLVATIQNNRDRSVAGSFLLQTGTNVGDDDMRRQGLKLMHQSGLLSERDYPLVTFNLGIFAYQADESQEALDYFLEAYEAGYSDNDGEPFNDVEYLILQSYASSDRFEEALGFGIPLIQQAHDAGSAMPDPFIRQTLQSALDLDDGARSRQVAELLVKSEPGVETWRLATRITLQFADYSDTQALDLYRLMHKLGTFEDRREYSNYIGALNENLRPVEIMEVLEAGIVQGAYPANDDYVVSLRNQVGPSARRQRADMDDAYADARQGGGNNTEVLALNVADQLLAVDDYTRAISLYEIARTRGLDADLANTRIGMTQIMDGRYAEGIATLSTVSGAQKPIADLWMLHAELEMADAAEGAMPAPASALDEAMEAAS